MFTVLLVDDEPTILKALSTCIPWQQFGIGSVLTASDGLKALDIISDQTVHLLITDIKMPRMDGMTLLRKLRNSHPEIHCILLTAYSEFEYARQALQLGVENYLLKPLQKEELEETIEKALDNIYANQKISHHLFRQNILLRWANGSITDEELSERANLLGINLYLPEYCAICISPKEPGISLSGYCKVCAKQLSSSYEVHYFIDDHNRNVFLIGADSISLPQITDSLSLIAMDMQLNHSITLFTGDVVTSAGQLPESYLPIVNLIDSTDLTHSDLVVAKGKDTSDAEENKLAQCLEEMFQYEEEEQRYKAFHSFVQKWLSEETSTDSPPIELISGGLFRLFTQSFPKQPKAIEQLHNRIRTLRTVSDIQTLQNGILELLEYSYLLYRYYINQLNPIIQSAIQYIHQYYPDDISIQEFCAKNKITSAYLGYLFKKETGLFFNNYLTQYRICCSIRLLLDTDLKINEIAQTVGFSSPTYYISCFKKQTGLSPIKYRRQQPPRQL